MKKRIYSLLLALTLLLSLLHLTAFASEPLSTTRKGTITVAPQTEYGDIDGEVTVYRVADLKLQGGSYEYVLTEDFAGSNLSLEDLESPELAVSLAVYAAAHSVEGQAEILDRNKEAEFSAYAGLYLVVHTGAEEGKNTFVPFLVVFPGTENGEFDYHITVTPKTGPVPDIPEWPTLPEETWPDETKPEETTPDETTPDETGPDETTPDETNPDETVPDETGPDGTVPGETGPDETTPEGSETEGTEPDETAPGETTPGSPTPEDEEKLPQTGQLNWPVPMLALAGLCLFIVGWALRFRSRKEDYEA